MQAHILILVTCAILIIMMTQVHTEAVWRGCDPRGINTTDFFQTEASSQMDDMAALDHWADTLPVKLYSIGPKTSTEDETREEEQQANKQDIHPVTDQKVWTWPCVHTPTEEFSPWADGTCYTTTCTRRIIDDFISAKEANTLIKLAERGMRDAPRTGGPTIFDMDSGNVKFTGGLTNIYHPRYRPKERPGIIDFHQDHYALYKRVIDRIRQQIEEAFGIKNLFFTAPTFITRLVGNETGWSRQDIHDEYWHPHVDKNNTGHYDYSGLLYLNDYGFDFCGGLFDFLDSDGRHVIEPKKGRLSIFNSNQDNTHRVCTTVKIK